MVKLDADLRSEYGLDLHDYWRKGSGLNARRLIGYIENLPLKSRIWRHLIGEQAEWDHQERLLADIRDISLNLSYFMSVQASKEMKASSWEKVVRNAPKPIPRPGDVKEEPKIATTEDMATLFGGGGMIGKPYGRKK